MQYAIPIFFSSIGFILFIVGLKTFRKIRIIRDTPTSKIKTMAQGLVEISGIADANNYVFSPLTKTKCLYYLYTEEVYEERGENDTASWHRTTSTSDFVPFSITDDSGSVIILPEKADFKVPPDRVFIERNNNNIFDNIRKGLSMFNAISDSIKESKSLNTVVDKSIKSTQEESRTSLINNLEELNPSEFTRTTQHMSVSINFGKKSTRLGDKRYIEYYIQPKDTIFVLGEFRDKSVHYSEIENIFIISDKSEKNTISTIKRNAYFFIGFGVILFLCGLAALIFKKI